MSKIILSIFVDSHIFRFIPTVRFGGILNAYFMFANIAKEFNSTRKITLIDVKLIFRCTVPFVRVAFNHSKWVTKLVCRTDLN